MSTCCCDPCCPDQTLLFGPGRTSTTININIDHPVELVSYGLGEEDCIKVIRTDSECDDSVSRTSCRCLTKCRPETIILSPGSYILELTGKPPTLDDPTPPLPDPSAVFVRLVNLSGEMLQARLSAICACDDEVSYGMLAILQDAGLFGQLIDSILADPVARCIFVNGLLSNDLNNSLIVGSDCRIYENDGGP